MSRQILILAAGKGTRMGSSIPKVLIPLRGKPLIKYLLEEVIKVPQATKPIVVVGFQHEVVQKELGEGYLYAVDDDLKGTGHAVMCAQSQVSAEHIIVLYGDMPFTTAESLNQLIEIHESKKAKISMFTSTVPSFENMYAHFEGFGRIIRDSNNEIMKIKEYADASEAERQIREVNPGIYMFDTAWLWKHMAEIGSHNAQGEMYLTDIVEIAIKDHQKIYSLPIAPEEVFGINTPEHLDHAHRIVEGTDK